jgi:hypothetical protein
VDCLRGNQPTALASAGVLIANPGPAPMTLYSSRGFSLCGTVPKVPGSCGMVGNPQECREHAKECLEQARSAPTLLVMTKFESLAHLWLRLADELESLEAVLRRLKKPEGKAS